jgi:hypothetical protein
MTTRFDDLQQVRAMLIRLLDDGNPLPPVEGVDDELDANEVSRLLVTCSTEIILHMIDPAKARAIWLGLSSDAVRRLEVLCRSARPSSPPANGSHALDA